MLELRVVRSKKTKLKEFIISPSTGIFSGTIYGLDSSASQSVSSEGSYLTLRSQAKETSSFSCKTNIQVTSNSQLSKTKKGELNGKFFKFNSGSKSTVVYFQKAHDGYFSATFSSLGLPVYIPESIITTNSFGVMADFDFIIQMIARKIFWEKIELRAQDRAVISVWRQFRTLLKHPK